MIRIGSMCTGYGGLDLGTEAALGPVSLQWVADPDPGAAKILSHHWPHVPNLGDIRTADWPTVPEVDVLTGGFPCQPVSLAGNPTGTLDERWLFDDICAAIGRMGTRPGLLVFENVPGLLIAGHGDAMARVVHGLAALGYVGAYRTLAASDIGAPHQRRRVFIVAYLGEGSHTVRIGLDQRGISPHDSQSGRSPHPTDRLGETVPSPRPAAAHTERDGIQRRRNTRDVAGPQPAPRQRFQPAAADRPATATGWGPYAEAIARWEHATGRPAPKPTLTSRTGRPVLAPKFVEWLMGLDHGHVTDVPGLSRAVQLRALGNGVVPAQATAALADLLTTA